MKKMTALVAGVAMAGLLAAPASAQDAEQSIAEIATDAGFSTLVAALDAAGLASTFADCDAGPFTVFAPTDEAFATALSDLGISAEALLADTATLTSILQYHVIDGEVPAATVVTLDGQSATTLNGAPIEISVEGSSVVLNGSVNVVQTDIAACNGIIHVIDAVLLPPTEGGSTDTTAPSVVSPGPDQGGNQPLADTGSSTTTMVLLAAGLALGGVAAAGLARRRSAA